MDRKALEKFTGTAVGEKEDECFISPGTGDRERRDRLLFRGTPWMDVDPHQVFDFFPPSLISMERRGWDKSKEGQVLAEMRICAHRRSVSLYSPFSTIST